MIYSFCLGQNYIIECVLNIFLLGVKLRWKNEYKWNSFYRRRRFYITSEH